MVPLDSDEQAEGVIEEWRANVETEPVLRNLQVGKTAATACNAGSPDRGSSGHRKSFLNLTFRNSIRKPSASRPT
jgi:hypothetical protein